MLLLFLIPRTTLQQRPNGENNQDKLQNRSARIVLVRTLDIARNDRRARETVERRLCLRQGKRKKREKGIKRRRWTDETHPGRLQVAAVSKVAKTRRNDMISRTFTHGIRLGYEFPQ